MPHVVRPADLEEWFGVFQPEPPRHPGRFRDELLRLARDLEAQLPCLRRPERVEARQCIREVRAWARELLSGAG